MAVAGDAGLDEDHGDFGNRGLAITTSSAMVQPPTGIRATAHTLPAVLGDGFRGGYGGVAQAADLYFQAMENDNTGNFQSPSLNNLLNTAYNARARTHTNSWGSSATSQQGKYNSETEDVDDRASYYDRYYNGGEGLTILFAAGNDGRQWNGVPTATAKNVLSVGNHKNRGSGSPDSVWSGSSRRPTDDGRIKPDLVAPRAYVRSCRAQEATDTGSATWRNSYYLEYTGTSMAAQRRRCGRDGPRIPAGNCSASVASRGAGEGVAGARRPGHRLAGHPQPKRGMGIRVNLRNSLAPPGPRQLGRRPFGHVGNRQQQIVFLQRLAIVRAVQSGLDLVRRAWLTRTNSNS